MVREAQVDRATLVRGAAGAAALSGLLNLLFFALHPRQGEPPPPGALGPSYAWLHLLGVLSLILGLFGLTAFYLVQHRRVGWLGLAGYLLAFIGSCGFIGFLWGDGLYSPVFERFSPALLDAPALFFTGAAILAAGLGRVGFALWRAPLAD